MNRKFLTICFMFLLITVFVIFFLENSSIGQTGKKLKPVSETFTGIWQGDVIHDKDKDKKKIGEITLTLCVSNGSLTGTVNKDGASDNAPISILKVHSKRDVFVRFYDLQQDLYYFVRCTLYGSNKLTAVFTDHTFSYTQRISSDGCSTTSSSGG